jgi:hypothetical protein
MKPFESAEWQWALAYAGRDYLVCSAAGGTVSVDLSNVAGSFALARINPNTGEAKPDRTSVPGGQVHQFRADGPAVLWLSKQ